MAATHQPRGPRSSQWPNEIGSSLLGTSTRVSSVCACVCVCAYKEQTGIISIILMFFQSIFPFHLKRYSSAVLPLSVLYVVSLSQIFMVVLSYVSSFNRPFMHLPELILVEDAPGLRCSQRNPPFQALLESRIGWKSNRKKVNFLVISHVLGISPKNAQNI